MPQFIIQMYLFHGCQLESITLGRIVDSSSLSASTVIRTWAPSLCSPLSSPLSQLDMLVKTSELSTFVLGIAIDEKCNQINLPNFGKNVQMIILCLYGFCVGSLCRKFLQEFCMKFFSGDSVH